jgi:putative copper resistance protein D
MDNFLFVPRSLASALFDAAFAGSTGLGIVSLWTSRDWEEKLQLRRKAIVCAIAMLAALCGLSLLLAATMTGSSDLSVIRPQFTEVMAGTHAGRMLLCNGAVGLALLALLLSRRVYESRVGGFLPVIVLAVLAATRAATGHAAADGDFTLAEFVQFIHLISIATWSGSVIATAFFVLPSMYRAGQFDTMMEFARRLSNVVTPALLLVVLTGVYNSYRGLGASLAPLVHTQWGVFLDIKVVLVGLAVSMGAYNRTIVQTSPSLNSPQASRLSLVLRAEAAIMLLILVVSAWLANSPPANAL